MYTVFEYWYIVQCDYSEYNYNINGTYGPSYVQTRLHTGSFTMSGPIKATVRHGGNAGNDRVILDHDADLISGGVYNYFPNTSSLIPMV